MCIIYNLYIIICKGLIKIKNGKNSNFCRFSRNLIKQDSVDNVQNIRFLRLSQYRNALLVRLEVINLVIVELCLYVAFNSGLDDRVKQLNLI